ncbi:MAG: nucleotidyltransferase domain-containing protein [Thermomicrobiales bacterium]|nr:nucleotidyltransferase domain-containing protein [Thermomicrobiales bacterium]
MHPLVAEHLEIQLLSEKYGVEKLEIFGSAMTDEFDPERSDVDFIVHYPVGYDFGYFLSRFQDFEDELAAALGRPAQLVMTSALRNTRFCRDADKTRMTVYANATNGRQLEQHQETVPTHLVPA